MSSKYDNMVECANALSNDNELVKNRIKNYLDVADIGGLYHFLTGFALGFNINLSDADKKLILEIFNNLT